MGITGLLPFLKQASRSINMREYKGCTVAVDSYCWLHKGAFSCAGKLGLGEKTESYVYYCMKFVNMLLANDIKPVMVFDGCNLPSKAGIEKERRERRQQYRKKAAQFLREGKKKEATECFQRCVDITSAMALELMKACRAKGVDCIVAPYEADAQLAYLNKIGIVDIVITEDSDLLLFGCERVVYKLDSSGNGIMIEKKGLSEATKLRNYTFERFRYMCILSGCDYLPSLPGIGLGKASKLLKVSSSLDFTKTLRRIPTLLKLNTRVTDEYVDGFVKADNTFLYQLVFDPLTKKVVPLNPYPENINKEDLIYAGTYFPNDIAYQMALGNLDVKTRRVIDSFNPDTYKPPPKKAQNWNTPTANKPLPPHRLSIWTRSYKAHKRNMDVDPTQVERSSTKGQEVRVNIKVKSPAKRAREAVVCMDIKTDSELASMYEGAPSPKRLKLAEDIMKDIEEENDPYSDLLDAIDQETMDDNLLEADDAQEQENITPSLPKQESPEKSWKPPRNMFAVSKKTGKGRFTLDGPKESVEVRSRFFSEKPLTNKKGTSFLDCMDCHDVISAEDDRRKSDKHRLDMTLQKIVSPKHEKDGSDPQDMQDEMNSENDIECMSLLPGCPSVHPAEEEEQKANKRIVTHAFKWGKFKSKFSKGLNLSKQNTESKGSVNKGFKPVTPKPTTILTSFKRAIEKTSNDGNESYEQSENVSDNVCSDPVKSPGFTFSNKSKKSSNVRSDLRTLFKPAAKSQDDSMNSDNDCTEVECQEFDYKEYLEISGVSGTQPSQTPLADIDLSQPSISMNSIDKDSISFTQSSLLEDEGPRSEAVSILDLDEDSNDVKIVSVTQPTKVPGSNFLTKTPSTPAVSQGTCTKAKLKGGCRSSGLSKSKGRGKTIKKNIENDVGQKNITNFFAQFKHEKKVEKLQNERVVLSPSKINIPFSLTPEMEKSCDNDNDLAKVQRRLLV